MKQIIQIVAAALIFFGLILYSTVTANAEAPVPAGFSDELTDSELPPDLFDENCDGGPGCPGRIFSDMPAAGHWSHVPIDWALTHHVTAGTTPTTFSPGNGCTRSQAVTFLWKAFGSPGYAGGDCPFQDVPEGAYYRDAVLWAVENQITSGTRPDAFSPGKVCTRAQIVTFLWRAKGSPAPDDPSEPLLFQDVAENAYYRNAVLWATKTGVTGGTSPTTFSPDKTCTRAEIVTFLYKAIHG